MPSMTGMPWLVVASPSTANTDGQASPTRTSGTGWTGVCAPVTPAWSAIRSGSQSTLTVARPFVTVGTTPPAAPATSEDIADAATSVDTTGAAPASTASSTAMRSESGRASGTWSSAVRPSIATSAAPVSGCSARSGSTMTHSAPRRWTGLRTVRPAQTRSGAARTSESTSPASSTRRRPVTRCAERPAARRPSIVASSKRRRSSATGSSTRSMPATETVPGMTQTSSAA